MSASGGAVGLPSQKGQDTPPLPAWKGCVSRDRHESEPGFITIYYFSLMFENFFFPNLTKEHLC